ncbi:MAG TPA: ABC transporter permease [Gaiellaceae bacterium]|nr:ABC transporter permease [Gaiellaceae bacterium]
MTAILTATPGRSWGLRAVRQMRDWTPAVALFVLGIGLWEGLTRALHVQQFLLPPPSTIVETLYHQASTLFSAGFYTWKEALGGFAIGSALGIVCAVIISRFRTVGTALMPIAIAANAVPIIAFAPIFNAWFDPLSPVSKMAVAAVLCFLPVMVNTLRGLTSVRREQLELMSSYAAGGVETFRRVRFPTALPYIFTALKVASVLAMIGAVVGEYFGGSFNALGVLIRSRAQILDFPAAWAAILVACLFGTGFYAAVAAAERLVVRWAPANQDS